MITVQMLEAFIDYSNTLNLSKTADNLSLTRQTVRQSLKRLESALSIHLIDKTTSAPTLTRDAVYVLEDAKKIILSIRNLTNVNLTTSSSDHPPVLTYTDTRGNSIFSQRRHFDARDELTLPLIKAGARAWSNSLGDIEHYLMNAVRPYLIVYRQQGLDWLCIEVGSKTAYARWYGLERAKSAVGLKSYDNFKESSFPRDVTEAYHTTSLYGGLRLDHVIATLWRTPNKPPIPVSFQRLTFAVVLPDGSPAVGVLAAITKKISITGPTIPNLDIPEDAIMDHIDV